MNKYEGINDSLKNYYRKQLDSFSIASNYVTYVNVKIYDSATHQYKAVKKIGRELPDSITSNTRFGNLKLGQKVDIYSMRPLFMFYDSNYFYPYAYPIETYKLHRRTDCLPLFNRGYGGCCASTMYLRLCSIYDIDTADVRKLIVPHDQFYWFFRKITIVKQECSYLLIFYRDKFIKPEDTMHFNRFESIWKNKAAQWNWEFEKTQPASFLFWPEIGGDYRSLEVHDNYARFLCELEKSGVYKNSVKTLNIKKKKLRNPLKDMQFDYTKHWFMMDFGDGDVFKLMAEGGIGDIIGLYKPWHANYWYWSDQYHYAPCQAPVNIKGRTTRKMQRRHEAILILMARQSLLGMYFGL